MENVNCHYCDLVDVACPYCNSTNDLLYDDKSITEDQIFRKYCRECGKNFIVRPRITYSFYPMAAPCLNGEPHNFGKWMNSHLTALFEQVQYRGCPGCGRKEYRKVPYRPTPSE